jgi:hypothetical protein
MGGDWIVGACALGAMGILINLFVSGGIGSPAVAQPLWAVIGLGLAGIPSPSRACRVGPVRAIPLVLAVLVAGVQLFAFLQPVLTTQVHLGRAAELRKSPASRTRDQEVTRHLQAACKASPRDSRPLTELALWHWQRTYDSWPERATMALSLIEEGLRFDPRNHHLASHRFHAHLEMAKHFEMNRQQRLSQYAKLKDPPNGGAETVLAEERDGHLNRAMELMSDVIRLNPTAEAVLHYYLASALVNAKDPRSRQHAEIAWQIHENARSPTYRLTERQVQQVEQWRTP